MDGEHERARIERERRRTAQADDDDGGSAAYLGSVTTPQAQIAIGKYLTLKKAKVISPAGEGQAVTYSPGPSTVVAVLLGPALAQTGDYLIAHREANRWAVERTAGGSGSGGLNTIPGCACSPLPQTLKMTSLNNTCNFRMFQSGSLEFGPPPEEYSALDLGSALYVGTSEFPDPLANNSKFRYILTCHYNQFNLSRIYASTPFGSPFRDGILYTWNIGGYGNTCHPFHLDNGIPYSGSDASCNVQIDE